MIEVDCPQINNCFFVVICVFVAHDVWNGDRVLKPMEMYSVGSSAGDGLLSACVVIRVLVLCFYVNGRFTGGSLSGKDREQARTMVVSTVPTLRLKALSCASGGSFVRFVRVEALHETEHLPRPNHV